MSALKIYVVEFENKTEHLIRSECFFRLAHNMKGCDQLRSTQVYSQSQIVSACQSFRPVAPFFFLVKVPFWATFNRERVMAILTCL